MSEFEIKLTKQEYRLSKLLIRYTEEILLPPIPEDDGKIWHRQGFICGDGVEESSFILNWAITKKGKSILDKIISELRQLYDVRFTRRKTLESHVLKFYQRNCLNDDLFNGDMIFFSKEIKKSLLQCSTYVDKNYFGIAILKFLMKYLNSKIEKTIFVYGLPGIEIREKVSIAGLSLLDAGDKKNWEFYHKINDQIKGFDPVSNKLFGKPCLSSSLDHFNTWLVMVFRGDFDNSSHLILRRIRYFLSLIIAQISIEEPNVTERSIAWPNKAIILFKDSGTVEEKFLPDLLHRFPSSCSLKPEWIQPISQKMAEIDKMNDSDKNRRYLFAEYFLKGLNYSDEQKLINFFIAVDAMWGIDGESKKSIIDGITSVMEEDKTKTEKASLLYQLRCDLLHGGCALTDEWSQYDYFVSKFNEEPFQALLEVILKTLSLSETSGKA